jgi:hypothetical protein
MVLSHAARKAIRNIYRRSACDGFYNGSIKIKQTFSPIFFKQLCTSILKSKFNIVHKNTNVRIFQIILPVIINPHWTNIDCSFYLVLT